MASKLPKRRDLPPPVQVLSPSEALAVIRAAMGDAATEPVEPGYYPVPYWQEQWKRSHTVAALYLNEAVRHGLAETKTFRIAGRPWKHYRFLAK